jgi:hypothetical protein
MKTNVFQRISMAINECQCKPMDFYDINEFQLHNEFPWKSMDFNGNEWIPLKLHEFQW